MPNLKVHFSSKSVEWATPQDLFDKLNTKYGPFDIDVCATSENKKCTAWFGLDKNIDGLTRDWTHVAAIRADGTDRIAGRKCWMNPPYSELKPWMKKAYEESLKGCRVVCLIPARTDTAAWHDYAMNGAEIILIRGRLRFGGAVNSAPFPSAIVIFDEQLRRDRKNGPRLVSWDYRRGGMHPDSEAISEGSEADVLAEPINPDDASSNA